MEIQFTWVDAAMIILMFITFGLVSGKNEYNKKMAKKEKENNDE